MNPQAAAIWQLAPEPDYGEFAEGYILTSPDGENEIAGPFKTEAEALQAAARLGLEIVPLTIDN